MANTPFLNLVKPTDTDQALITDINNNSDKIDTGVSTLSEQIATHAIAQNTDLNNLTTEGDYECATNTIASSLSHSPVSMTFTMMVRKRGSYKQQIIVTADNNLYIRNQGSQGWSDWQQLATVEPVTVSAITVNASQSNYQLVTTGVENKMVKCGKFVTITMVVRCNTPHTTPAPGVEFISSVPSSPTGGYYFWSVVPSANDGSGASMRVVVGATGKLYLRNGEASKSYDVCISYISA